MNDVIILILFCVFFVFPICLFIAYMFSKVIAFGVSQGKESFLEYKQRKQQENNQKS